MAQTDWTYLNDGLDAATVDRGVTSGIGTPNGGGSFLFGFNSLAADAGAVGLFTNQVSFAPLAKGGSVRAAIQRGPSGGPIGFSPLLFLGMQGKSVNDSGYLLGLEDDDPHHIVLRKGALVQGLPSTPGAALRRSTDTFAVGTWLHLRLDMVVNDNGDVILQSFASDLTKNPVTVPVWQPIAGLDDFTDDALAITSGTQPFTSGYAGFGYAVNDVTRRAFFDQLEVYQQL